MFVVDLDSDGDLSPGEFSPRAPVHSTATKGRVGAQVPKESVATGLARAYDLGELKVLRKIREDANVKYF